MNIYEKPAGVETRWISFENATLARNSAGLKNRGAKGHAFEPLRSGATTTLLDIRESGSVRRIWITVSERSPDMLRGLRLDMFWDGSDSPAVSAPLGDFFGVGLGSCVVFENALFSNPEGRSFVCFIPMPFRTGARVTLTNETSKDLANVFYDIDLLINERHSPETLYFHTHWRRESPNELGRDYRILPNVTGTGRFLGCNVGILTDRAYEGSWWGEGEVKVRFGGDENPTLCGTGTEDYIGTGWGQGVFCNRTQGCLIADREGERWCFYRYHLDDPIYFDDECEVSIQTLGGNDTSKVLSFVDRGTPAIPVSVDTPKIASFVGLFDGAEHDLRSSEYDPGWTNFWRQDDWSSTAYFYLDRPSNGLPPLPPLPKRLILRPGVDRT